MSIQIGAFFPTNDLPADRVAIRDWAQAAEAIGFDFVVISDHVLGADWSALSNFDESLVKANGSYDVDDSFHEIFVTMAYIAAVTERVGLASGILILPQRQTALVTKQAAQLDYFHAIKVMADFWPISVCPASVLWLATDQEERRFNESWIEGCNPAFTSFFLFP